MERYLRGERIGTGGTATVFRATDERLNRPVALKVLHSHFVHDPDAAGRLDEEVRITASLSHPGIVAIYDYGNEGEQTWVAMELMTGGDLRRRILLSGSLPARDVAAIARQVLEALAEAHAAGVIHRDIKPRNILFDDTGRAKIADFGLAQSAVGSLLSQDGAYTSVAGTAEYCAPEAITAGLWDARTDLYALGCTLYEALTGRPPYVANTPDQVLRSHVEKPTPPVRDDLRRHSPGLVELIESCIEKDPNDRPQSAEEALEFLNRRVRSVARLDAGDTIPCGNCGAPISSFYPWCFSCGRATIPAHRMRRHGYTVVVRGPGKPGEQLRPELRDLCCRATESQGFETARLRKRLPRVPFVLVRRLSRAGAHQIVEILTGGGVESAIVGPNEAPRAALVKSISRKTMTMAPRVYFVMLGMGGSFFSVINSTPGAVAASLIGTMLTAVPATLGLAYSRALVRWGHELGPALLPEVAEVLRTVSDPLLHARMRSVAGDAAALRRACEATGASDSERAETATAVNQTVAGVAGLVQSLSVLKASAKAAGLAAFESTSEAERSEASKILRSAEGTYTKTMERIGATSLALRRLALRLSSVEAAATSGELSVLGTEVRALRDEVEATEDLEEFLERIT